ncbi:MULTISPECIES: hypothetical protein [unclassified Methanoculleus]|uniref:hypothetical protein n=1 Tax=unclassified Methanoculleus TaxID=2619537 RepID=UPI0025DAEBA7|nr:MULTISPECIES: hypothetical protein [unclassified Methanoculleus]
MADITGSDVPRGQEVKWYAGGVATTETITVAAAAVTAGGFALTGTAEYGSVVATVNGTPTAIIEYLTSSATPATEAGGCDFVGYTGITEGDVVVLYYIDVGATTLTQVAACLDVKFSASADTKTAAVHGQANKLNSVGAVENTADLSEFYYNQTFVAMCIGDQVTGSPAAEKKTFTTRFTGVRKIGALVGKRANAAGTIVYKWFIVGARATGLDSEFPTEDNYKRSMRFQADYLTEVDLS